MHLSRHLGEGAISGSNENCDLSVTATLQKTDVSRRGNNTNTQITVISGHKVTNTIRETVRGGSDHFQLEELDIAA